MLFRSIVGPNPTRFARLSALRHRIEMRIEVALMSTNEPRLLVSSNRVMRVIRQIQIEKDKLEKIALEMKRKSDALINAQKVTCNCPACLLERTVRDAIQKMVGPNAQVIVSAGTQISTSPSEAIPHEMKAETELNELVAKYARKSASN